MNSSVLLMTKLMSLGQKSFMELPFTSEGKVTYLNSDNHAVTATALPHGLRLIADAFLPRDKQWDYEIPDGLSLAQEVALLSKQIQFSDKKSRSLNYLQSLSLFYTHRGEALLLNNRDRQTLSTEKLTLIKNQLLTGQSLNERDPDSASALAEYYQLTADNPQSSFFALKAIKFNPYHLKNYVYLSNGLRKQSDLAAMDEWLTHYEMDDYYFSGSHLKALIAETSKIKNRSHALEKFKEMFKNKSKEIFFTNFYALQVSNALEEDQSLFYRSFNAMYLLSQTSYFFHRQKKWKLRIVSGDFEDYFYDTADKKMDRNHYDFFHQSILAVLMAFFNTRGKEELIKKSALALRTNLQTEGNTQNMIQFLINLIDDHADLLQKEVHDSNGPVKFGSQLLTKFSDQQLNALKKELQSIL
jgi:hypothetical protein